MHLKRLRQVEEKYEYICRGFIIITIIIIIIIILIDHFRALFQFMYAYTTAVYDSFDCCYTVCCIWNFC